ncbi:MAG: hypothetical protein AABO41_25280 [Acidobacteriota bacterium]
MGLMPPKVPGRTAPPSVSSAAAPPDAFDRNVALLMGLVRDIREEAQNIERSVVEIKEKGALDDTSVRAQEVTASLVHANRIFAANEPVVRKHFDDLRVLFRTEPRLYDGCGDEITEIANHWERICNNWPSTDLATIEILARLARVESHIAELEYHCGLVTIPHRLTQHLETLRTGQTLDFHDTFKDELPRLEDRLKLLQYLYAHPAVITGIVDVPKGLIYRASPKAGRRRLSFLIIALTLLAGVVVLWLYQWIVSGGPPPFRAMLGSPLLKGYLFIALGSLAHILIDAVKQSRAQANASFRAIDDWVMWVHVTEVPIMSGIASLWIGIIGLDYFQSGFTATTAFFVGYSIDSFVDLFLERFSGAASASAKVLTEQVKSRA